MKITQIADKNFITNLKISCDEYNNYLNMLKQIKKNGYNNEYWLLWKQFMDVCSEFNTLKEQLRVNYVVPIVGENHPGEWTVDFKTGDVFIHNS